MLENLCLSFLVLFLHIDLNSSTKLALITSQHFSSNNTPVQYKPLAQSWSYNIKTDFSMIQTELLSIDKV